MDTKFNILTYALCLIGIFSLGFPVHELVHYLTMDKVSEVCLEFGSGNVAHVTGVSNISHPELLAYGIQAIFSFVFIFIFTFYYTKDMWRRNTFGGGERNL